MSLHLGCVWFNTPPHLLPAFCSPHWQISTFLCSQIWLYHPPARATHLENGQTFIFDGYQNWFKVLCKVLIQNHGWFLVWKMCHLWSTVGNKVSLGVGFFLSGSIDRRKDDLRRPLGGLRRGEQARKDCDEHLSNHYATYSTAYSIGHTCRFTHTHRQPDTKVGLDQNLQL